jgi:hypothetical protein
MFIGKGYMWTKRRTLRDAHARTHTRARARTIKVQNLQTAPTERIT